MKRHLGSETKLTSIHPIEGFGKPAPRRCTVTGNGLAGVPFAAVERAHRASALAPVVVARLERPGPEARVHGVGVCVRQRVAAPV